MTLSLASSSIPLKLNLAGGQNNHKDFENVDLWAPNAKYKIDLFQFPWPWADSSVDEILCSHFIEHIPTDYVMHNGVKKDLFLAFFDECYRILKPDSIMTVICPSASSDRAFQDPTHRRFIVAATFWYLSKAWRKEQALDHYPVECDFLHSVVPSVPEEDMFRSDEAQAYRFLHLRNTVLDFHCTLKSLKPKI